MRLNAMAQQHKEIGLLMDKAQNTKSLNPLAGLPFATQAAKESHALSGSVLVEMMRLNKRIEQLEKSQTSKECGG